MSEDKPLYVAVFRDHPLGAGRFTKDFRRNLTGWGSSNRVWWEAADEEVRRQHFDWSLNHVQYHYSTDKLDSADLWSGGEDEEADRLILEQYAPVDFVEVEIKHNPPGADGWGSWYLERKSAL